MNQIEELNFDYLKLINSKEYNLGCQKYNKSKLTLSKLCFKINRRIHLYNIKENEKNYNFSNDAMLKLDKAINNQKKIVVYSCISGNYDKIYEPKIKNVDFIMFSDCKINSEKWEIQSIPKNISKIDNILKNRYLKFHPKELFKDKYDYSIYIDGNIEAISDISKLINLLNTKEGIAMHKHYSRKCAYDEGKVCIYNKKGNKNKINDLILKFKKDKFPNNFGLLEAPIIVTDLNNEKAIKIEKEFYNELVNNGTYRDQIGIPYVLWKNNIHIEDIGTLGENIHYNYLIRIKKHK